MKITQTLKTVYQTLSKMPYTTQWITLLIISAVIFGWWDEALVWIFGVAYLPILIPIYYIIEYGVLLPYMLYLTKKTYRKLNVPFDFKTQFKTMLKNTGIIKLIYKLKNKFSKAA